MTEFSHMIVDLDALIQDQTNAPVSKGGLISILRNYDRAKIETYSAHPPFYDLLINDLGYTEVEVVFGFRKAFDSKVAENRALAEGALKGVPRMERMVEGRIERKPSVVGALAYNNFIFKVSKVTSHKKVMILTKASTGARLLVLGSANASMIAIEGEQPEVSLLTSNAAMIKHFEEEFDRVSQAASETTNIELLSWGLASS